MLTALPLALQLRQHARPYGYPGVVAHRSTHVTLPVLLQGLLIAVQQTSGFESWQADLTPLSLEKLGEWFATQVKVRPRTQEELQEIENSSSFPIAVPNEELTNYTFSLAVDTGMYLSQVLIKNNPSLKWDQQFGNKKDVNYGQPVLIGFGMVSFNPVWLLVTLAYGVISKRKTGKSLSDLHDVWAKMVL